MDVPPGFVLYSEAELRHLFDESNPDVSESALTLIHEAKMLGVRVIGNYPDIPLASFLPVSVMAPGGYRTSTSGSGTLTRIGPAGTLLH